MDAQPFKASDYFSDNKHHLLIACSGSVATIKLPLILSSLSHHPNLSIRLILTHSASQFLQNQSSEQPALTSLLSTSNVDGLYLDADEWKKPWVRGDSILHIELRRWADLMVIAPLSANMLAKITNGMADDLLSSVVRAWDTTGTIDPPRLSVRSSDRARKHGDQTGREVGEVDGIGDAETIESTGRLARKKIIVAPSMNTAMWLHPVTKKHIDVLKHEWGVDSGGWFEVLEPANKTLACGDVGSGAMREWKEIVELIEERLELKRIEG